MLTDKRTQSGRAGYVNSFTFIGGLRTADWHQNGYKLLIPTPCVVLLEISNVPAHLVEIGCFRLYPILELNNENGPVLQNNEIGSAPSTPMELELENETEA
jgi:hypothetical protein